MKLFIYLFFSQHSESYFALHLTHNFLLYQYLIANGNKLEIKIMYQVINEIIHNLLPRTNKNFILNPIH